MQDAEYDIEGFGILKIAACSFEDSLPHFDEAGHLGIGDGYVDRSGEDAEFLLLRAGIVNTRSYSFPSAGSTRRRKSFPSFLQSSLSARR